VEPRPADPGPGRAVVEYIVMPVYDTEDALAISGADAEGLLAAVDALARPPAAAPVRPAAAPKTKDLGGRAVARTLSPLRDVLGAPVWDLAASSDGKRILAGLMAWGNNLACLSDDGKVLTSGPAGKYFPMRLAPLADGFAVHVMENDPIVNYLLLTSRDGNPERRLAATGRQIGGTRDASAKFYDLWKQGLAGVTPDRRFATVTGSRGIAVWDVAAAKVLWRDDSLVHDKGGFAQVGLSPDGSRLAVAHGTRLVFRDGRTGAPLGHHEFPAGTKLGTVRMYDGHWLILGDTDLFAFRDGAFQWQWSTPAEVTAQAFAADGLHWCVGGPDGSVRLMHGGTQTAGYKAPSGAVIRLATLADGSRVALATTTGWVGVLDASGVCQWQQTVGSRAVIAFAGPAGHTVVGDWRGFVRRFDAKGKQLWATDLTPRVYRNDLATVLTAADATPALYVPPPDVKRSGPPQGKENLAAKAMVTHVAARSGGWRHELRPQKGGGAVLNNGQADDLTLPWYDEYAVNAILGSEMKDHPAWELAWKEPVTLATLVVRECTKQPDAVPEEVAVQVWVEENGLGDWREVLHEYWNRGVVHTHAFGPVTTKKVRYIAHGDLGRNLWTTEIEAYGP